MLQPMLPINCLWSGTASIRRPLVFQTDSWSYLTRRNGELRSGHLMILSHHFTAGSRWFSVIRVLNEYSVHPVDPGFISSNGPGFDAKNSEHMLIAVEYVEEFVAQSETYPLDPSDQ